MAYVVEMIFRGSDLDRLRSGEAHRAYWKRMAERGVLLGGGPWQDGTGELLLCEARDRNALLRILYADPYAQAQLIMEMRVREWNAVMGHVVLAGLERTSRERGTLSRLREDDAVPAPRAKPVREELTAHERRIATMMLDGMTNRQIAEAFTVSTRAIELHITRIYRKLDIRRRAQLASAIQQFDAVMAS